MDENIIIWIHGSSKFSRQCVSLPRSNVQVTYSKLFVYFSYGIMLRCWAADPEDRPTFNDLSTNFGDLLQASVRQVGFQ